MMMIASYTNDDGRNYDDHDGKLPQILLWATDSYIQVDIIELVFFIAKFAQQS